MPAFSMMVRKPEDGDPAVAERIRSATAAYTLPSNDLSGLMEGEADGEQKVSEYRRLLAEMQNGGQGAGGGESREREAGDYRRLLAEKQNGGSPSPHQAERRRQTSRRNDGANANKEGGE